MGLENLSRVSQEGTGRREEIEVSFRLIRFCLPRTSNFFLFYVVRPLKSPLHPHRYAVRVRPYVFLRLRRVARSSPRGRRAYRGT